MNNKDLISDERRDFCLHIARGTVTTVTGTFLPSSAQNLPLEIPKRENIDTMNASKLSKVEAAVAEMMERSQKNAADPKGWLFNAEPHNAFCSQPGENGASQIHFCYWFLPWHRAYLAVTEKKIREIAGDSSLTLPYWNWTSNRRIPHRLSRQGTPLAKAVRYTQDRELDASEIDHIVEDPELRALGVAALAASRFVAISSSERSQFSLNLLNSFGGVARPNIDKVYGNGRLEGTPHGPVHAYVGGRDPVSSMVGDMANFATAARDPIFFAHHCNLDRLWEIWRSMGSNRAQEPTSATFLKRTFIFPWLDGSLLEVPVVDTLDAVKMGCIYDNLKVFEPTAQVPQFQPESVAQANRLPPIATANVQVPLTPESTGREAVRYYLQINGVETPDRILNAGVYVYRADSPETKVHVGAISVVRNGKEYQQLNDVLTFDITVAIQSLKTNKLGVMIIPQPLGGELANPYRQLRYRRMVILRH